MRKKIKIAVVGLGFGSEFIPIYKDHPDAELIAVCQRNGEQLNQIVDKFDIRYKYTSYEELLKNSEIDAVHINTPIPLHGQQTISALKAGKHVACAVPMATTIQECEEITKLTQTTGLKYMMMETALYTREFLFIEELYNNGEIGKIQHIKASHNQDMDGWPNYWKELAPMHYSTHCVAPILGLIKSPAESVSCFGSGATQHNYHGSSFALESCHIKIKDSDVVGYVSRSLYDLARQYRESFEVYGSKKSIEWPLIEGEPLIIHTAKKPESEIPEKYRCHDFANRLPKEIQKYTQQSIYDLDANQHLSFVQGSGHGGSHPHLVHQFISMLMTGKETYPNARQSANITCVGIMGHESAMRGGEIMYLPDFSLTS